MNITQQNTDALNAVIHVKLEQEDYLPKVNLALKNLSKQAQIKGFRKGKVPVGMIKKMHGNAVLTDEINKLLQSAINDYIKEQDLSILGHPVPVENPNIRFDLNQPTDYTFSYELGLSPEISLDFINKDLSFVKQIIAVEDKMIDDEVTRLRKQFGRIQNQEKIEKEDTFKLHVTSTDANTPLDTTATISEKDLNDGEAAQAIRAMNVGDTLDIDLLNAFNKEPAEVARFTLNMSDEEAKNAAGTYHIKLQEVSHVELADLDASFFEKLKKGEKVHSEETLRSVISDELSHYFSVQADNKVNGDIIEDIVEQSHLELPEAFLRKWIKLTNENPISDEDLEKDFPSFSKNLKWTLLINKIAKQETYKIEEAEIIQATEEDVKQQMMQYGLSNLGAEMLEQFVSSQMKNTQHVSKTSERIMERKVLDYIKKQITIKEEKVPLEVFTGEK